MLWQSLWRWTKRRRSGKSAQWIAKRYWHRMGGSNWVFAADTGKRTLEGKPVWLRLVYPTETKIQRHTKIKGDGNPFDPCWRQYLEERKFFRRFGISRYDAGIKSVVKPAS